MKNFVLHVSVVCLSILLAGVNCANSQNVGVDVPTPLEKLDVAGAIRIGTDQVNSTAAPSGGSGTIRFRSGIFEGWNGSAWIPLGGGADLDWTVSGNNQYSAVSGNVGIGTTSPAQKVHLANGNMLLTQTGSSVAGIELMPRTVSGGGDGGGRIFFREDNNNLFG